MKKSILSFMAVSMVYLTTSCINGNRPMMLPTESFTVTIENVSTPALFSNSGVFNTPVGAESPSPIGPGGAFEFDVKAGKGERLTFITMFAQSNDIFYAPGEEGIALYDAEGMPKSGDVTDEVMFWDAGTEVNEEPGVGPNQAPRQAGPNTGPDENGVVQLVSTNGDGYAYPEVEEVIKVTLTPMDNFIFKVRIENVSEENTLMTDMGNAVIPLSPGVWVIHSSSSPLFKAGEADMGNGVEGIAEDGNPSMLHAYVSENMGFTHLLSPGVWAVHTGGMPIYQYGKLDYGDGLEAIAEDGNPTLLGSNLPSYPAVKSSGIFNIPSGADAPSPLLPGHKYEFNITARQGDKLSIATMYAQSNDLFYAFDDMGISLYERGESISGDVTHMLDLYDAGTEVNQEAGYGPDQAPRQSGPNTGESESMEIKPVDDSYTYPDVDKVIKVTITKN